MLSEYYQTLMRSGRRQLGTYVCASVLCAASAGAIGQTESSPCGDYTEQRRAYFGDTHVHTGFSLDANWRMGARSTPDDAYRFARGAPLALPPFDENGNTLRQTQLSRPLDFAMVSDHSEGMDTVRYCRDLKLTGDAPWLCGKGTGWQVIAGQISRLITALEVPCKEESAQCTQADSDAWQDTIAAAQAHQQDCEFTAFIGYEWSGSLGRGNNHRNVVFRTSSVPALPISSKDEPYYDDLLQQLDAQCRDGLEACEALTIPHNSNLSQGKMFSLTMGDGSTMTPEAAQRRARYERLAEIIQHKGASECFYAPGMGADELCDFELLSFSTFTGKYFPLVREAPVNDTRYLRNALALGQQAESVLGVNPFAPGFIGSTDNHTGAAGAVEEDDYSGNHGAQNLKSDGSVPEFPDVLEQNPGGLAVLYAEENTRDALFGAMQRREAYGTSGPRIQLRVFGGWSLAEDLCNDPNMVEQGYSEGVPMGGVLPAAGSGSAPRFLVAASRDVGTPRKPGSPLQHVQMIKSWVDEAGDAHEAVFNVAGSPGNGASVDLNTCAQVGSGHDKLCTVWQDPDFNPEQNAYYYARVLQNPSCRWQQEVCAANKVQCDDSDSIPPALEGCCSDEVPKTIQERAWSSPIWYQASGASTAVENE